MESYPKLKPQGAMNADQETFPESIHHSALIERAKANHKATLNYGKNTRG